MNYRVLITDSDYKHCIAMAKYIKREMPEVALIGHSTVPVRYANHYGYFDDFAIGSLAETLAEEAFDQVIPVGGLSTLEVAQWKKEFSVLPDTQALEISYNKQRSIETAKRIGVPAPATQWVWETSQLRWEDVSYPCVVKPDREVVAVKAVRYCRNEAELQSAAARMLQDLKGKAGVLVQEYIKGSGHGFFALMDRGKLVRAFMHRRLREYPPGGGASTAAAAYYSPRLAELGTKMLTEIGWHGVAMVEFKLDDERADFFLMEINGKFWGSLELALRAGVNFGADLIRLFRGEQLEPKCNYNRNATFFWPLDGDLVTLWKTRSVLRGVREYFGPDAATNVGQSFSADLIKSVRLMRDLIRA